MTRRTLRLALMVFATVGLGVLCGQSTLGTATKHKRSSDAATAHSGRAKRVSSVTAGRQATAKSLHTTSKSAGTTPGSATAGNKASGGKASSGKTGSGKASSGKAGGSKVGGAKASANSKSGKRGVKKSLGGRQRGQMAPTPERITEIQQALAKNGALSGEPSGKWDDSTTDAMRKFQAAHGLNANGKLDAPTLNQLGLGASTAGMAAPAPAVKTSSTALPADIQQ